MGFCTEACCNSEARARKEAAERAEFERRQGEFEAFLRERGIVTDPAPPVKRIPNTELTDAEMARLDSWFLRHPAAAG